MWGKECKIGEPRPILEIGLKMMIAVVMDKWGCKWDFDWIWMGTGDWGVLLI
jgi:hypothetical protein